MRLLNDKIRKAQRRIIRDAPKLVRSMTNDAATYFKVNVFRGEGFDVQPTSVNGGRWKKRKGKRSGRLLVKSGRLRRSITANSRGKVGVVETRVSYGAIHNEGKGKMPMRKFMGASKILNRKFDKKIRKSLKNAFER